jgi:hypothetical protein
VATGAQLALHETQAQKQNQKEGNTGGREKENWALKIEDMEPKPETGGSRSRKTYTRFEQKKKGNLAEQGHRPLDPALR